MIQLEASLIFRLEVPNMKDSISVDSRMVLDHIS